MRRGQPSGATPLDRSSGQGAAAPLRFAPGQWKGIAWNYGDTPSNTDLRCGLEGVGTTMRTANLQGHAIS